MTAIRAEFAAEVDRLAELATRSVGATSAGLDVLEPAIRAAMTAVGARLLGDLLSLDAGIPGSEVEYEITRTSWQPSADGVSPGRPH